MNFECPSFVWKKKAWDTFWLLNFLKVLGLQFWFFNFDQFVIGLAIANETAKMGTLCDTVSVQVSQEIAFGGRMEAILCNAFEHTLQKVHTCVYIKLMVY